VSGRETEKALREAGASVFFEVLRECGALKVVFPEINALFGVPQPENGILKSIPACTL